MFAWAVPAMVNGSPVDHTWVTDFDNRDVNYNSVGAILAAGLNFWFCWGDYHPAGRFIGDQSFDPIVAACLVEPNATCQSAAAAKGTIFTYGVDGVCHQLANQVLYSTNVGGAAPLTVTQARGYGASSFLYGTYGLQNAAWTSKIQNCSGLQVMQSKLTRSTRKGKLTKGFQSPIKSTGAIELLDLRDDFELQARSVLIDDPTLLERLLSLRTEVRSFVSRETPGPSQPPADMLNSRNQHLINQAAKLLGPEKFQAVFGFRPDENINLVDPAMIRE